jgi:hypothetical protein
MELKQDSKGLKFKIENLRRYNLQKKPYIPLQSLFQLISQEAIQKELKKANINAGFWWEITEEVLKRGWRVFAVLVLIEQVWLVKPFREMAFLQDDRLPLEPWNLRGLKDYSITWALHFYDRQWEVLAPCFSRGTVSRSIDSNIALPFVEDKRIGGGSFGDVYEVSIDQEHQHLRDVFSQQVSTSSPSQETEWEMGN